MTFATFVGLDLHKRYLTACALAADGTLLGEVRRMPVTMEALLDFLSALPVPATIAVEATLSWAWLHERLEHAGYAVHVVDAHKVNSYARAARQS
jgi:transposase